MDPAFPGNSNRRPAEKPQRPEKLEPIVTARVTQRKKPLSKRFLETFVGGDARGTLMYVVGDILVPAAKDMLTDAVTQGFERMIFGDSRGPGRSSRFGHSGPRNYSSYSRPSMGRPPMREDPREVRKMRGYEFDEIILETRAEAEAVLTKLEEYIDNYDVVTVATLYELVSITAGHQDAKWGWDDLRDGGVERLRGGGYLLSLPRPQPVD